MWGAIKSEALLVLADGKRYAERITVLQCHRAFNTHHIGSDAERVVGGLHDLTNTAEDF